MVLTPGPNMIYLISRSITQGRRRGSFARRRRARVRVLHAVRGVRHHGAVVRRTFAYDALRFAGAAYLLWLAWQAIKPGGRSPFQVREAAGRWPAQAVRDGACHQLAQPEDRDALSGAAAAIHRSRSGQRAHAVAWRSGAMQIAISVSVNAMIALAAGSIALFLGTRPMLAAAAALADGHGAGGTGGEDGVRGERRSRCMAVLPRSSPARSCQEDDGSSATTASIQLRFHAALGRRAGHQRVVPALDTGKILQLHLVARVAPGPAEDGEIGDRQRARDEVAAARRRSSTP